MTQKVKITVRSTQTAEGEAPETMELVSIGTLTRSGQEVCLCYDETELTGLRGTRTEFHITPEQVTLIRSGSLTSQMVFTIGQEKRSLYEMDFGALMMTVRTEKLESHFDDNGGFLHLLYRLIIEEQLAGLFECFVEVRTL